MAQTIQLLPSQVTHASQLKSILQNGPFALDFSMLGAGKTYTGSYIALDPDFGFKHVIVIAPVSVKVKWLQMKSTYALPITHALSFCEVRSVKCKQPKHGLLHRRDYKVQMTINHQLVDVDKWAFTASQAYLDMVKEGTLLIIDEMQNVKNITSQFGACQALIKPIVGCPLAGNKSRVLMLSGSPIDKKDQVVHMYRTLGIMKAEELSVYSFAQHGLQWRGMQEIEDYCRTIDDRAVDQLIWSKYRGRVRDANIRDYCYELFQRLLRPAKSSSMMPPQTGVALNKRNGFYHVVDPTERALLTESVGALSNAISWHGGQAHIAGMANLNHINLALMQIETAKIGTFIRIARQALEELPNRKVVICLNYSASIGDIEAALAMYNPLILNGSTNVKKRGEILAKFQAPSLEHRLLLGNVSVCSTGIDLDDKHGAFPRKAFVSANYNTISLYQLGHRFQRADTKSDADIHFVYGAHATEHTMLNALARKSAVMKETTVEQVMSGVVFPGDFERYDEPDFGAN